ncbi:uncharacterized protein A4U43_C02F11360 [Asparagus officinalis]|uniref:Bidirectional sugar transporter SWEET n=1 Tax=Asparagus officinalis TaxID=4686 RepID=A0A5P1FKB4_ASPOF|nr:bidirectional sugar transporter SWEET14-like [Asparagus officinalis]ONK77847.1 uncharacterized protein A4U43_C02F11360 [Asparagus officinalis]
MFGLSTTNHWAITFGVLGNVISFMVYLAPAPTFWRVYRKKSTEGFQSIPYIVALFSAMLWIYYALIKTESEFLLTINGLGCIIETIYIIIYLIYAPKEAKVSTVKLLLLLNVGIFGLIVLVSLVFAKGADRVTSLGWMCVGFSVLVFVAPLSIIRLVIKTKSVEFMPFSLSLFLTLSAVTWFLYGFLSHDKYIAIPNVLGFAFGLIQMVLYTVYMDAKKTKPVVEEHDVPEHIINMVKIGVEVYPIDANKEEGGDYNKECELTNNGTNKENTTGPHEEAEV